MTATLDLRESTLAELRARRLRSGVLVALFALLMVAGFVTADARNAGGFWEGLSQVLDFPAGVVGEAVDEARALPGLLWRFLPSLIETVNIAAASTLLGAIVAIPLALLCTRGLALHRWLVLPVRRVLDVLRAVPEIVVALLLIFALGGGPVPAMIAIALHTVGALGKLFSEVAENAPLGPVEGLRSTGATWWQRMWLGVVPQVSPDWTSYALLRFEINIRASAILGFVGAGGIGYDLRVAISWGQGRFDEAAAIFILLLATIVAVDQGSSAVRRRLAHGTSL